jgi:hypothetical protein
LLLAKTLWILEISIEIRILTYGLLGVDDLEFLTQLDGDLLEERDGCHIEAITLILPPRPRIRWVAPVERILIPVT